MISAIRHTGLVVTDVARAIHFWCELLGFRLVRQIDEMGPHIDAMMGLQGVKVTTAKLAALDGSLIELLQFHSHPDKPVWGGQPFSTGFTHIALTVSDLDGLLERLVPFAVTVPGAPQLSPDGMVKVIYVQGPEGVLLELVQELKQENDH
jgi:catechol 2,3-dioxygenase-like lactoylglutathione lyase family enzyme